VGNGGERSWISAAVSLSTHPVFSKKRQASESIAAGKGHVADWPGTQSCELSTEAQSAALERLLETGDELAAKEATQQFDREKKSRTRFDPARVIET